MKIKQSEAIKAFRSIRDLNCQKMPSGKLAKQVYELYTKLKPAYDFQVQEEQKIYIDHPEFDPSIGGISLKGKTPEEKQKAIEEAKAIDNELQELSDLDFELDYDERFTIDLDKIPSVQFSGEDIGNLEKFINFI